MNLVQCVIGARVVVAATVNNESPPMFGVIAGLPATVYARPDDPMRLDAYIPVLLDDPALIQGRDFAVSVMLFAPDALKPGGNYE